MIKFFKEHFVHFVLFVFESAFTYLHKQFDIYYDFECQKVSIEKRKDDVSYEESGI